MKFTEQKTMHETQKKKVFWRATCRRFLAGKYNTFEAVGTRSHVMSSIKYWLKTPGTKATIYKVIRVDYKDKIGVFSSDKPKDYGKIGFEVTQ